MKKAILLICCFACYFAAQAQTIKGNYAIKNVQTGLLLRVKDAQGVNGTPLVGYSPENWKCMTWDFKQVDSNTYQLKNLFTGKTFQPEGAAAEGVLLNEQPFALNNAVQQYVFEKMGKNEYLITLKGTGLYITADKSGEVNSRVKLSKKTGAKDQLWTIYEQSPTM